jgi:hypothetical protein
MRKIVAICYMTRNVCDDNNHHQHRGGRESEIISRIWGLILIRQ